MHGAKTMTSTLLLRAHLGQSKTLFQSLISLTPMPLSSQAMHVELGVSSKSPTMASRASFLTTLNLLAEAFSLCRFSRSSRRLDRRTAFPAMALLGYLRFFQKLMWSEGFTIFGSPLDHFRQLWPQDYNKFCNIIEEYEKEMKRLAGRLMWLMLGSLGISMEDVKWAGPKGDFRDASAALQLNSYPACPDPDRAMGLAAHTDSTLLTILYQNNTSGLQVLREGTGWVTVPPLPGALVVNVGDLIHILSNGLYPSVLHRAVVNRSRHRLSIAYLYGPPDSVQISPLSKLLGPSQPPLYRPITWNEYLGTKAKHFNKALSSVRLCAPLNALVDVSDHNSVKVG
ncbi:unnamed protein product [Prunus armeniaca]|uniref:Fe2OG dioxygenase domain-containing protein n=1 Tax=Prunus armeniaca TaxID=36596 RepID=A0A6J5WVS0_PRUAR|nr:unnamed protein product [Prunus armeniaca]